MNLMRRFPCIAIPETLVVRNSLADASLWILHLIGSFGSNLSRHLFERFGFGESDGWIMWKSRSRVAANVLHFLSDGVVMVTWGQFVSM